MPSRPMTAPRSSSNPPPAPRRPWKTPSPRCGPRRPGSILQRPGSPAARWRARSPAPCSRSITGPARWCRPAGPSSRCCRRAISRSASMCRKRCCRGSLTAMSSRSTATAARPTSPPHFLHREFRRVHAAGDLQPRGAFEARIPGRGAAQQAGGAARRPADRCRFGAASARQGGRAVTGIAATESAMNATVTSTAAAATAANAASDIAIEVEGLTKSFDGKVAVRGLTMKVRRGLIYGFLGPNGSGKTTTIRMLCGLLTPDSGRGTCLGYDIRKEADKIKKKVGYMTQRFSLYQDLSVRENLEFIARIYGLARPKVQARAMIARLGLEGRERQLAGELSGGWKPRLALGACTLPEPQLLLLDEPTAGVDPKARREFWNEIHA